MFDPTYQELVQNEFSPVRTKSQAKYPEYLGLQKEGVLVIAIHIIENEYAIHLVENLYGRYYHQHEIDGLRKFDKVNSLEKLICLLKSDQECP